MVVRGAHNIVVSNLTETFGQVRVVRGGGATSLFSLLGGAYGPLVTSGALLTVVKCLPSYWLIIAEKSARGGGDWPAEAWIVIVAWTVVTSVLAVRVYQRDTRKIQESP